MTNWVFDLDNTIYNTNNIIYSKISVDSYLRCLINNLSGKKYIFTNATLIHAEVVLKQLGIIDLFDSIIDRIALDSLKPNIKAFRNFVKLSQINTNIKTVFFEDNKNNLIASKNFGWLTVLINPVTRNHNKIDYTFTNIHTALEHFSFNPGLCYKNIEAFNNLYI